MTPRPLRFSLTFLFVLTLVAAVALSYARLPVDPTVEVIRVTNVLLLVLYFLKWSLQDHEQQGARIRATIAAVTFAALIVYMAATLPLTRVSLGLTRSRSILTPALVLACALFAFQLLVSIVIVVWQANDYAGGWRPRFLRKQDKPWLIDEGPSQWWRT